MDSQEVKQVDWGTHILVNQHQKRELEIREGIRDLIVGTAVMPAIVDITGLEKVKMLELDTLRLRGPMMNVFLKGIRTKLYKRS